MKVAASQPWERSAPRENPHCGIDFTLPFFPARLTALYHAPSWRLLDDSLRIRYTQLYALYLNEQTVFFEELLASTVLPALYSRPDLIGRELADGLRTFEAEEQRHSRWFREMNHRIDPERFSLDPGGYVFIPLRPRTAAVGAWFAGKPLAFPCWIWLILLQEERSIHISRECINEQGAMEPNFRQLHRKHMADEIGHVRWDTELIERIWTPMPMWKRRIQARLFGWLMREFFTVPKRAGKAVLDALIGEFPELSPLAAQLRRELADLAHSESYHASLYSREITPKAFALFDALPEFADIGKSLPSYRRQYGEGVCNPFHNPGESVSPSSAKGLQTPSPYSTTDE